MLEQVDVYLITYPIMGVLAILMGVIIFLMLSYVAGPRRKPIEDRSFLQRIADADGLHGEWSQGGRGADG